MGEPGDTDLVMMSPNLNVYDAVVIEFDFVPSDSSIGFNYVFASEEFPEFASSAFNDAFGLFISGPGIQGDYTNNAKNIALLPNSSEEVSVNNIYGDGNGAYYNTNTDTNFVYDGFSDVLTAETSVIPCETYHLKLVIADRSDECFNSALFLQAYNFSTNAPVVTMDVPENIANLDTNKIDPNSAIDITFHVSEPYTLGTTIPLSFSGTAVLGTDYTILPNNNEVTFEAGSTSSVITILPILNDASEDDKTILLSFNSLFSCMSNDTLLFLVNNATTNISESSTFDEKKAVQIYPNPSNGAISVKSESENLPYTLTVRNSAGQVVYQSDKIFKALEQIELPENLSGYCTVKVVSEKDSFVYKIIVE